jgi:hypothetical protein
MWLRRSWLRFRFMTSFLRGAADGLISILKGLEHVEARIRSMQEKYEASAKELTHTDQGAMYVVMGHALSAWARMEEGLVVLVELFLLSPGSDKAGLIMYSIVNFNVWLTIINDLYAQEPRFEAFKPRWNKISARIRRIKDIRDRLAHEPTHIEEGVSGGASLRPSRFDVRAKNKKYTPLTIGEIMDFATAVANIASDLTELAQDMMAALKASQEKSPG